MKANQKFLEADEAVSPVIGVILMVAITVVLAAVVFVLVSDLGGGSGESQPAIAWSVSQADGQAEVTSADPGANWNEFELRCVPACEMNINGAATDGADYGTTFGATSQLPEGGIGGGDYLEFCIDSATAGGVTATLRHIDSNSVAREFVFNSLDIC